MFKKFNDIPIWLFYCLGTIHDCCICSTIYIYYEQKINKWRLTDFLRMVFDNSTQQFDLIKTWLNLTTDHVTAKAALNRWASCYPQSPSTSRNLSIGNFSSVSTWIELTIKMVLSKLEKLMDWPGDNPNGRRSIFIKGFYNENVYYISYIIAAYHVIVALYDKQPYDRLEIVQEGRIQRKNPSRRSCLPRCWILANDAVSFQETDCFIHGEKRAPYYTPGECFSINCNNLIRARRFLETCGNWNILILKDFNLLIYYIFLRESGDGRSGITQMEELLLHYRRNDWGCWNETPWRLESRYWSL